jgi:hypothetical protein
VASSGGISIEYVSTYKLARVGRWSSDAGGFTLCADDDERYHADFLGGCSSIEYGTAGNAIPADRMEPIRENMPNAFKTLLIVLAVIQMLLVIFFGGVVIAYRRTRILKAAQPVMMILVLMMAVYGAWRIFSAALDIDDSSVCTAHYWLGHLSFTGIIALFAKTLRVNMVVNSGKLKRVKITTRHVLIFTAILVFIQVVYMIISSTISPHIVDFTSTTAITGRVTFRHSCISREPAMDYVLYGYEALILLLSAKLCYDTRDVPDAINEAYIVAGSKYLPRSSCGKS